MWGEDYIGRRRGSGARGSGRWGPGGSGSAACTLAHGRNGAAASGRRLPPFRHERRRRAASGAAQPGAKAGAEGSGAAAAGPQAGTETEAEAGAGAGGGAAAATTTAAAAKGQAAFPKAGPGRSVGPRLRSSPSGARSSAWPPRQGWRRGHSSTDARPPAKPPRLSGDAGPPFPEYTLFGGRGSPG